MNKDKVIELLKTVSYPGFSRDIVSFGMVQDVKIEDDSISVILQIKTQNDDKKENVPAGRRRHLMMFWRSNMISWGIWDLL